FSSRRRHTRFSRDWSSDVCSPDLWSTTSAWARSGFCAAHVTMPAPNASAVESPTTTMRTGRDSSGSGPSDSIDQSGIVVVVVVVDDVDVVDAVEGRGSSAGKVVVEGATVDVAAGSVVAPAASPPIGASSRSSTSIAAARTASSSGSQYRPKPAGASTSVTAQTAPVPASATVNVDRFPSLSAWRI